MASVACLYIIAVIFCSTALCVSVKNEANTRNNEIYSFVFSELIKLQNKVEKQASVIDELEAKLDNQKSQNQFSTSYVRWGRKSCRENVAVVYKGYVAGPHYRGEIGSGSNYLCLHVSPQWKRYISTGSTARIYGTQYEVWEGYNNVFSLTNNGKANLGPHPAPCSVCNVQSRSTTVMIPARTECPAGWTKEYGGYVVSSYKGYQRASYICWDEAPETAPGGYNKDQSVIYHTDVHCGTLPCSTYISGRQLTCVVCSK